MSGKARDWAWSVDGLSSPQKFVLLALADRAGEETGECWPSIKCLEQMTALTDRCIQQSIKKLMEVGLVERIERSGRSTVYRVTPESDSPPNVVRPEPGSPTPERHSPPPRTTFTPPPNHVHPRTQKEPKGEPKRNPSSAADENLSPTAEEKNGAADSGSIGTVDDSFPTAKDPESRRQPTKQVIGIDIDTGTWNHITDDHRALWAKAYPALDLDAELARAAAWLKANRKNAKSNYERYLTNWFSRAQDRAPRLVTAGTAGQPVVNRGIAQGGESVPVGSRRRVWS